MTNQDYGVVHVPCGFGLGCLGSAVEVPHELCLHPISIRLLIMARASLLLLSTGKNVCWSGWCHSGSAPPSSRFELVRNVTLVMFLGAEVRWQLIATCVTKKERYQSFIVCNGHALLNHLIVCASVNT
ncbi:hypothetical protein F2Q69_00037074 [Brassica cretica]|uniref:Uncharacterized protein n=1 Tax=Brassica cretica TaxID=69181 RepID=A0A8S9SFA7_BRACR|nr:hypothetical protein F2Q69_00037074 [Brassica cretica]